MYRRCSPSTYRNYVKSRVYKSQKNEWSNPSLNPVRNKSTPTGKTLYVAIIDSEYSPQPFQCLMKKQWVDDLSKYQFIDGIEYYSRIRWTNDNCNITTIVTPPSKFPDTLNPTSWILLNTLKMFIERSNSEYLFIVGDSCYLKVDEFVDYFSHFNGKIIGSCIEQRYFFQMLVIGSGIIVSRQSVLSFLSESALSTWDVTSEVGIADEESFSQIGNQVGFYMKNYAENKFIGRQFREIDDFDRLKNKNFDGLPSCTIPKIYINNPPGEQGICSAEVTPFNRIISWSAALQADPAKSFDLKDTEKESQSSKNKFEFLKNADQMLNNNPDFLAYYWAQSKPRLCRLY